MHPSETGRKIMPDNSHCSLASSSRLNNMIFLDKTKNLSFFFYVRVCSFVTFELRHTVFTVISAYLGLNARPE